MIVSPECGASFEGAGKKYESPSPEGGGPHATLLSFVF